MKALIRAITNGDKEKLRQLTASEKKRFQSITRSATKRIRKLQKQLQKNEIEVVAVAAANKARQKMTPTRQQFTLTDVKRIKTDLEQRFLGALLAERAKKQAQLHDIRIKLNAARINFAAGNEDESESAFEEQIRVQKSLIAMLDASIQKERERISRIVTLAVTKLKGLLPGARKQRQPRQRRTPFDLKADNEKRMKEGKYPRKYSLRNVKGRKQKQKILRLKRADELNGDEKALMKDALAERLERKRLARNQRDAARRAILHKKLSQLRGARGIVLDVNKKKPDGPRRLRVATSLKNFRNMYQPRYRAEHLPLGYVVLTRDEEGRSLYWRNAPQRQQWAKIRSAFVRKSKARVRSNFVSARRKRQNELEASLRRQLGGRSGILHARARGKKAPPKRSKAY